MAVFSRNPREHWLKPLFSKNEVAKSGPAFHSNGNPERGFGIYVARNINTKVAAVLQPHPPKAIFSRPFHKTLQGNKKSRATLISLVESGLAVSANWWRRRDSNSRPPRCERDALPTELLPHS